MADLRRSEIAIADQISTLVEARKKLARANPALDDAYADAILALEWARGAFIDIVGLLRQRAETTPRRRVYSPGSAKERVVADGTKGMERGR